MQKTNFSNKEIKNIADFAMNNKQIQKKLQENTDYILEQVKNNRLR